VRYLVTGHTGFKGAWLSLWLRQQGHEVHGLSLDPEPGALFELAGIAGDLASDARANIRDAGTVLDVVKSVQPEVVIHMAAQPLVRESYRNPRWTMETNVMGTLSVLEASQTCESIRAQLIITTDKVYRNVNQVAGYLEEDSLGADDPYSASKAMADILTQSWVTSFQGPPTAIVRAGNVIGGGDVSKDRLLPDIVNALIRNEAPQLRYPQAVRPWQHVLDCLSGYLTVADALLAGSPNVPSGSAWNFGPDASSFVPVGEVTTLASNFWGKHQPWVSIGDSGYHEANLLALDASKAAIKLGWRNQLPFTSAVEWSIDWYRDVVNGADPRSVTLTQLERFHELKH
jgi:CDP-glucose 4,6-dehydratase